MSVVRCHRQALTLRQKPPDFHVQQAGIGAGRKLQYAHIGDHLSWRPVLRREFITQRFAGILRADALSVVYSDAKSTGSLALITVTFDDGSHQQLEVRDQPIETKEGRSAVRLA